MLAFRPTGNDTKNSLPYNPASTFRGGRGHFLSLKPRRYSITKVTPTDSATTEANHEASPASSVNRSYSQR
jgi:hypothetical protein